jgi:hypothetical protein
MSICINDDLIWVSSPKCASTSIESAFINSNLNINHYRYGKNKQHPKHIHIKLADLYQKFGKKDSVVIKRDYFDRWISGLQHMWYTYELKNCETIIKWEDINNNFIYETFTSEFIDEMHSLVPSDLNLLDHNDTQTQVKEALKLTIHKLVKTIPENLNIGFDPCILLFSQLYWVNNIKCTYEFNINEIEKFENFISNRYNIEFKVNKLNESKPKENQIIKDEKLKQWVFENFEKRFEKRNSLI